MRLLGVYLFVKNLEASEQFYADLGLDVEHVSDFFARGSWGDEAVLEMGTQELTLSYDPGWQQPSSTSKSTLNFEVGTRDAVDENYARMLGLGYPGHLPPIDALWQARFAILEDPDGNFVGLHSERNVDGR
jgi:catechol 2,3-dioxygenase-like lactoylglutathione lyase family enzyme